MAEAIWLRIASRGRAAPISTMVSSRASISAVLAVIFLYGPSLYKKKKQGGPVRRLPLR